MTPEELDKARVKEARRLWHEQGAPHPQPIEIAARLAREGWTPPDPISPRVLAAREYTKSIQGSAVADAIDAGLWDDKFDVRAFLAGFAAAVKLAEPLVEVASRVGMLANAATHLTTYRQSIGDGE